MIKNGVAHRDLKPENILFKDGFLKLADFGLSKQLIHSTEMESIVGTEVYMAPEVQQRKKYTSKCDIWSLGFIFYEILTGKRPWKYVKGNYLDLIKKTKITFPT